MQSHRTAKDQLASNDLADNVLPPDGRCAWAVLSSMVRFKVWLCARIRSFPGHGRSGCLL